MQNLIILFLALLPVISAQAEQSVSQVEIEARLKALEKEISNYKETLDSTQGQKSEIEATLERNEQGINKLINEIDTIEKELDTTNDKVSSLTEKQKELLTVKSEQQYYIEQQVRAAYEIGSQEYLKVLLNQEDPNEIARMLTYYDYFNQARSRQIESYNLTLLDLDRVTQELAEETVVLESQRRALGAQQKSLTSVQKEKQMTLKALISQISTTGSALLKLEQDRGRLEQLLDKLEESLANLDAPRSAQPFAGMQGKLLLPVEGRISHRFGNQRNQGKLRWHGIFINAAEGESVYAVHYGRVVFSDWLRGFGLLMIISHGEGYMSLYGHNQALFRETGDWVSAGEVIAAVGDSGGQDKTGLYFEIRIDGKPNNPQNWCVTREQRAA
ncbi:MAG: peptidoglycan DD-metalloendopeptidase family protein [Gammaproteobacteria bacterium]|jgi:septal ring factor EnvC (AmiA/AmiB activator)|nr:peptidoglycan DD-metalloendopeptidase family protein [Gammaproteobacteria bacterium]MBT3870914.1 peptidoglycan DD-metalloendopeptidase family protein [Gammaproteobacteria bacterium]MBT4619160.1 peptidoglycan DD-metalloendopeptidase family protein [Gammaproteobacteria bacterium]MBT5199785.1 peptidoglycan DD-metalloendopeptidase family protein [Gammaproteobacteria bacterium]MBT5441406.1 peptidoglycan DD-metalloendopeptidase family protein [Gammaproteobacteria bacterium]|tara:strand:- start:714 stop:1874 length:1161 start_codon:yes stop_codon:yes gene_type:complete